MWLGPFLWISWCCRPGHRTQEKVENVAEPGPVEPLKEVCLGSGWEVLESSDWKNATFRFGRFRIHWIFKEDDWHPKSFTENKIVGSKGNINEQHWVRVARALFVNKLVLPSWPPNTGESGKCCRAGASWTVEGGVFGQWWFRSLQILDILIMYISSELWSNFLW